MQKTKSYILYLIFGILVLFLGETIFLSSFQSVEKTAYAEIPSASTGFTPSRNINEEHVYHLFRTQIGELTAGKEIMFVGGTDLANTMVVPEIPAGSATLRVTSSGKAYITDSLTCYVDVLERGNGFDWCESGTLNYNATEYSCSYSGVQHYKGAPFNYSTKTYYNTARVGVFNNDVAVTNATVQLFDGNMYFSLASEGNGYYSSTQVFNGRYEIVVNNEHTGQALIIDKFTIGENGTLAGDIFYSGNTYTENVYFYTMGVKTYLDGALSNVPGEVYLKSARTNCALTRSATGVYGVRYILCESSAREYYSVIVGGADTGYKLNDLKGSFLGDVSIYYYTLSLNITTDNPWTNARVELRNADGEVRSVLTYKSTSDNTTLYTNIMQKDEANTPEKMTVFVDYVATDAEIYSVRSGARWGEDDKTFASVVYYDATVNLNLDNDPFTLDYTVLISNGVSSYSIVNSTGTISLKVRQIMDGNEELPYKVVVSGVTDNLQPLAITRENKSVTYNYHTVNFYTYTLNGTVYVATPYRVQYVRDGSVVSLVSDAYVSGMTFDKWSLTTWSEGEDLDSIEAFDFSTIISKAYAIYPHFAKTEVKINDSFVKTNLSGAQSSTGVAFRMANVTITGFEKGNESIKSILLNLQNVENAYFYSTSGKTFKQGQNENLQNISGGYYATQSAISIVFNNKVSMSEAQDYIRNNVVIKPIVNQDVKITLTVSDGVLSTSASTSITQEQWGGTAWTVKEAGTYSSWWIGSNQSDQYVYFTGNCTFNGSSSGWGGLEIYGNCYLYIPAGVTVTCNGVAGNGRTPGGAGVYVPSGSNLYVLGDGTLVAKGGKAGNGSNGAGGGGGWKSGSTYGSGGGGAGGAGGGGAGAGIGTHGAYGGNGGNGGSGGSVGWSSKGKAQFWGRGGNGGGAGGTPSACGNIYINGNITVNATGGAKGANGNGGGAGGFQTDAGTGWKYNHCAAGGGGGGGGGAGFAGNSIGAGGAGGGGGGGGGSGACDYHSNTDYNCIGGGKGGYGGNGANGAAGNGGNAHCDHQDVPGGGGGGRGGAGTAGAAKSTTLFDISTDTNTEWTITFTGATSNGEQTYAFESKTIVIPDYVPEGKNLFLGWKVSTYGYNAYGASSSKPLTTAEATLYQPGETIKTALGTYGNIVLTPITMPYDGKIAKDILDVDKQYFAPEEPIIPTYQNYAIQAYLDGVEANVGTMVFTINDKNYKVESSASSAGLYSLTLEADVETFTAKINGVDIVGTLNQGTNEVYFESLKVVVTGNDHVQSILLVGAGAPVLSKDEEASSGLTNVYSVIKQQGADDNEYGIIIDGDTIPESLGLAQFGATVTVPYCKVSVNLNTNMVIDSVELVDDNKNSIPLRCEENVWIAIQFIDTVTDYKVYVNGFDTKVTTKLDVPGVELNAKIYEFKLVTRVNGVVSSSIATLTVNGRATIMKNDITLLPNVQMVAPTSTEYWSYVVVNDEPAVIESNGIEVATITPDENLGNTYVDYFTVQYVSGDASGDAPVDENIYLAGQEVTILSQNTLSTTDQNTYLAGWSALDGDNYSEGDVATINGPLVLTAVLSSDLLKVHYVDYFGEIEVKSRLSLTDNLVAYDGDRTLTTFNDYGRTYTLKGWVLDIDTTNTIYASGEVTNFVAGDIIGDSEEEINVYFTAIYNIEYLSDIHFELELSEEDTPGVRILGEIGEKFTVNYRVTVNDGVHAILLIPQFDRSAFKISDVLVDDTTTLSNATISGDLEGDIFKIALEGTQLYDATGEILISIEYEIVNNIAGKYTNFGFVLDYPEDTTFEVDNLTRSNAWYIIPEPNRSAFHGEVQIFVDNEIAVIIQAPGTITIEEQSVVYHGASLTVGHVYVLATAFDSEETYYEFVGGEFVVDSQVNENNFANKNYYIENTINDVLFAYSGYGQQVDCLNPAQFTIKWYTYDELSDTYTEIQAPMVVGDYYVGVSSTASDFVYSVEEVKQLIHIVKAEIIYQIHDKTSVWSDEIVALTGEITSGTVYNDDNLNIELSTTATSQSNVGNYEITGTFENDNYDVTIVSGTYVITKRQIKLGLDATAKFIDGSFAYDSTEKTISATIANFYTDILSVSYAGGEEGCSGNGAINVKFNENNEVVGYTIVATFTINQDYIQNCEFIKDENENEINTLSAVLTITISGITKQQFEALVSEFVEFSVVDGQINNALTPVDNAMTYQKTYDAIAEYAKVVVNTEKNDVVNDKISPVVTYKLGDMESVQIDTTLDFNYSNYMVKNANVYTVTITFKPGKGYAFEVDVNPVFTISMLINKHTLTIQASATVVYLDDEPEITLDNGTNGWIENENYATYGIEDIQDLAYLVNTTYVKGNNAGTSYELSWDSTALGIISEIIYNYNLTLTTTTNNIVSKKVINIDEYEFEGYAAIYDGQSHTLALSKNGEALTNDDLLLISYTIVHNSSEKYTVKDVVDSGDYIATISLKDTVNYIFSDSYKFVPQNDGGDQTDEPVGTYEIYWTVNEAHTSATVTKAVAIGRKVLIIEVDYTKSTATLSLSGFVTGESASDLTNLTYLLDGVAITTNVITASAAGHFEIAAQSDNNNYSFSNYTLVVYEVSFVTGSYDQAIAGAGFIPQSMPTSEYIFCGYDYDSDEYNAAEVKGMFTADVPEEIPTLRHYTFSMWSGDQVNEFDFAQTIIEDNITIYALWEVNDTYTITYKYRIDQETTWNNLGVDTFYVDDALIYGDTLQSLVVRNWFASDVWYFDTALKNRLTNGQTLDDDTILYGHYRFDIGLGDVNADGDVDANDITLYRQWIVGGYEMIEVDSGDEWATVISDDFNVENTYFVKRVADSNAQTTSSMVLGDGALDIRDVSTIRMALVGGFGFDIVPGVATENEGLVIISVSVIDNVSKLLLAVGSGKKAMLSDNINEDAVIEVENLQYNIVIDLNGKTITVPSFSLALASDFGGKIEIKNGSIVAVNGISFLAPSGTIILNDVTMFDENGEFTLSAADHSLYFVGNVELLKDDGNGNQVVADVTIPSKTHVVVESGATLLVKNIVIDQVLGYTFTIELNNSQEEGIIIQGDYIASGSNTEIIDEFFTVNTLSELTDSISKGFKIRLGSDIISSNDIVVNKDVTLDLNGHDITFSGWGFEARNGATLTLNGNGIVSAVEAPLYAQYAGNLVINGGIYVATSNFVVATNGTQGRGGNTVTINGGVFNGSMSADGIKAGYLACGVYVANNDTVAINGGTFNIENGVGILARSGNTTIGEDVVFNVSGNGTLGKVGDSQVTVPAGEVIVWDLVANYPGGVPTLTNNSTYDVYALVENLSELQAVNGVADSIKLYGDITTNTTAPIQFTTNTVLYLNNHQIQSTNDIALRVIGDAKLTIEGNGNVVAQEACVMAFDGAEIEINGGTFTSYDNFVVGTNGLPGRGENTITINGGVFNGYIESAGYIANGIYLANNDTLTVNNATFNVYGGIGILARAGSFTVANSTFNIYEKAGLTEGWVGDAKIDLSIPHTFVIDTKSNYPGYDVSKDGTGKVEYNINGNEGEINNNMASAVYLIDDNGDYSVISNA